MEPTDPVPSPIYVAVGIPCGILMDREGGPDRTGAVRRGGEFVFIGLDEYRLWTSLLTPTADIDFPAGPWDDPAFDVAAAVSRLWSSGLLAWFDTWDAAWPTLASLRPMLQGVGLGNAEGDPDRFLIRSIDSSERSLHLDPVEAMVAWELDGATTLHTAAATVAGRVPDDRRPLVQFVASRLLVKLMRSGLALADGPGFAPMVPGLEKGATS